MELREQIVCAIVGTVDGGDVAYDQWVEAAEEVLQLIQPIIEERDALRAEIETMKKQEPVMRVNSSNINSSRINKERGGRGDQHTCSETQTTYHDTQLYALPGAQPAPSVPDDVIDQAVTRFLSWKLPRDFRPDGGMVFIPTKGRGYDSPHWPTGTNLFNAQQAREMLRHVLAAPEAKP